LAGCAADLFAFAEYTATAMTPTRITRVTAAMIVGVRDFPTEDDRRPPPTGFFPRLDVFGRDRPACWFLAMPTP
jgi:hypothetical protein